LVPQNSETPNPKDIEFVAFIIPKVNLSISMDTNRSRKMAITRKP